ncbi:alpha/beta hydrolase [Pedobacter changchengzhani]|uniref:Alpha/beta hydrolase n=1 Tax=Pedobacter changchengzhani TaxID=2529274 RepID=A0A4R5MK42_9SPHI|nr:alpha/beta hydrolase [Pedobacter changchengzhani]TDG36010.1 alpha/beta hydrolase [Pedobacter changchengzhani]
MKKFLFLILLNASFLYGFAQQTQVIKLWPNEVPGETQPKHAAEEYLANKNGNVHRISNITDPLLQVFKPTVKANGAAIIICPGGGNKYLALDIEGEEVAHYFADRGYLTLVLQYRVPMKTLGSFQDVQRAVRLVRSMASKLEIDSNKIGVMGFSAGGNLATRATTGYNKVSYPHIDLVDSVSCRPDFSLLIYPGSMKTQTGALIPEVVPTEKTPPVFIFAAADDQFKAPFPLGQALIDLKLPFEFHVVPKGGHGYGLRKGNPAAEAWPKLAESWLGNILITKSN